MAACNERNVRVHALVAIVLIVVIQDVDPYPAGGVREEDMMLTCDPSGSVCPKTIISSHVVKHMRVIATHVSTHLRMERHTLHV